MALSGKVKFQRRSSEDLLASLFASDSHCQRWFNRKQDGDEEDSVAPDYGQLRNLQPNAPSSSAGKAAVLPNSPSPGKQHATDSSARLYFCPQLGDAVAREEVEFAHSSSALGVPPPSQALQPSASESDIGEPSDSDDDHHHAITSKSVLRRRRASSERPHRHRNRHKHRTSSGGRSKSPGDNHVAQQVSKSNSAPGMATVVHDTGGSGSEKGSLLRHPRSHTQMRNHSRGKKSAGTLTSGDESEQDVIDLSSLAIATFGRVHRKRLLREVAVLFCELNPMVVATVLDSFYDSSDDVFDLFASFDWFLRRGLFFRV
jgi:hypothetical protein